MAQTLEHVHLPILHCQLLCFLLELTDWAFEGQVSKAGLAGAWTLSAGFLGKKGYRALQAPKVQVT